MPCKANTQIPWTATRVFLIKEHPITSRCSRMISERYQGYKTTVPGPHSTPAAPSFTAEVVLWPGGRANRPRYHDYQYCKHHLDHHHITSECNWAPFYTTTQQFPSVILIFTIFTIFTVFISRLSRRQSDQYFLLKPVNPSSNKSVNQLFSEPII